MGPPSPASILAMQRTLGNAAVVQRLAEDQAPDAGPSMVHSVLRSNGRPLDDAVCTEMESRLGADFSGVRVHTDAAAHAAAESVQAHAFTSGAHIVFQRGRYDTGSAAGKRMLAHELTHVVQQRSGPVSGTDSGDGLKVSDPSDRFEREAETRAERAMAGPVSAQRSIAGPITHGMTDDQDGATVQRSVGFEFEAQWNVRNVSKPDEAGQEYERAMTDRESKIHVSLLQQVIEAKDSGHFDLTDDETQMSAAELTALWVRDGRPTNAGLDKLHGLGLTPRSDAWGMRENTLMQRNEIGEVPLYGANLDKGQVVVNGQRFDLTADASPSGGSNLEWVTDPLDDRAEVKTVLGRITEMADYLNSKQRADYIPSEQVTAGGGKPVPQLRIYPHGGELLFAPQTTAGLRIDQLADLIDFIESERVTPKESLAARAGTRLGLRPGTTGERPRVRSDLFTEKLPQLVSSKQAADAAIGTQFADADKKGLVGLMSLLGSYLRFGDTLEDGANAKSIAGGLMSRTDFAHNFSLLTETVRQHYRDNPDEFVRLALASAGLDANTAGERIFRNSVERGLAGSRVTTQIELTRRDWLVNITQGSDLLKNWKHLGTEEQGMVNQEQAEAIHTSLGAMGTTQDKVGPDDGVLALIAELRQMRRNLKAKDLKPVAVATFDLIEQLNLGKDLVYRRKQGP